MTNNRLEDVRWEPCPAMLVAYEVFDQLWEETQASQLRRIHVRDLTHFVALGDEPLPEAIRSPAANIGLVCSGTYPDEALDEDPVVLQAKFDSDRGFRLVTYLREHCCPTQSERRALVENGALNLLMPRRGMDEFVESDRCPPLLTDWHDESSFRDAVREAVETFIHNE